MIDARILTQTELKVKPKQFTFKDPDPDSSEVYWKSKIIP